MDDIRPEDEFSVIKQCLDGDADKYSILVERYKSMVYNAAYRMLGDGDTAEEAAQDAFVAAYEGLKDFRYGSKFSSWLYSIVLNKCRDKLRSMKDPVHVDEIAEHYADIGKTPEQSASSRQTTDVVQNALNALPGDYREVIVLKHIYDLDYQEISDILGVSVSALKVRAHRGRDMLKTLLEGTGVGNG